MKYETPEAFRTALEQRLKNEAEASGTALMRLRKQVAFELGRADDEETATKHLNAATGVDLGDFSFEVRRTPALDAATGFRAVRYTVRADLDGRRFEQFPTDVAFSESPPTRRPLGSQGTALALLSTSSDLAERNSARFTQNAQSWLEAVTARFSSWFERAGFF